MRDAAAPRWRQLLSEFSLQAKLRREEMLLRQIVIAWVILTPAWLRAQYFMLDASFDVNAGHESEPIGDIIKAGQVDLTAQGAELERFDVGDNATGMQHGFRYPNKSQKKIRGIRLTIEKPDKYRFDPAKCKGGHLFQNVKVQNDGKEVLFGGGLIEPDDIIFIEMTKRWDNAGSKIWYRGEALTTDPAPVAFATGGSRLEQLWSSMLPVCPSRLRQPILYAVDDSMRFLCIYQNAEFHVFDKSKAKLFEVLPEARFDGRTVNRISFEKEKEGPGSFLLWSNSDRLGRIQVGKMDVYKAYSQSSEKRGDAKGESQSRQ
jgi:hypothetical protein